MASNIYDILDKIIDKVKTKSTVSVVPKITSGEEIGTISVDATPNKLYHPTLTSANKAGNVTNLAAQLTHGGSTVDIYADGITTEEETDLLTMITNMFPPVS